jgi:hypothetical protein
MKEGIESYKRKAVMCSLEKFDYACKEHSYVEVTEWHNGEGFDVNVSNHTDRTVYFTHGEFKLIKKLIKELEK